MKLELLHKETQVQGSYKGTVGESSENRLREEDQDLVLSGPLEGSSPYFPICRGYVCITSYFTPPTPPLSHPHSVSLSGHANCSQGQHFDYAPLNLPTPALTLNGMF